MHKTTVCMVLTNELNHDTRVLNEANALGKHFNLTILAPKGEKLAVGKVNFKIKEATYRHHKSFVPNMIRIMATITRLAWRENPDIYHAHDLDGLWCAFLPALFKRKILIYDSHELWSDLPPFKEIKRWRWILPFLERLLVWRVDHGVTVNESIAQILSNKYHKPFLVVRNLANLDKSRGEKENFNWDLVKNKEMIIHIGSTGEWRGMDQIIAAAQFLSDNIRIVFLGADKSIAKYKKLAKAYKVSQKIIFWPPVAPNQILNIARCAKIGLVLTQNSSLDYFYSTPNKLFQYVAAEIPLLGSVFPEFRRVISGEKIGEVVQESDPRQIARKITQMLKSSRQKAYHRHLAGLAQQEYNWEKESQKLIRAYNQWRLSRTTDFTLVKYRQLCESLLNHYPVTTFQQTLKETPAKFAMLRHDVDRLPFHALKIAKLEAKIGIRASFYFRSSQLVTHLGVIKKIAQLGHEVGYHYECLDQAKGDTKKALQIFEKYLTDFRQIYPVKTIAMHGNPLTRFNNRHLWAHQNFKKYGILGETYLSLARGTFYFSDTGRTWSNRYKIKDVPVRTNHEHRRFKIESTNDLINLVENAGVKRLCIVTHPERWSDNWLDWLAYLGLDKVVQAVKNFKKP